MTAAEAKAVVRKDHPKARLLHNRAMFCKAPYCIDAPNQSFPDAETKDGAWIAAARMLEAIKR